MQEVSKIIMNTPTTIAALISGTIAIIGIVIQSVISLSKHKIEEKTYFEQTLQEKLEKIYSPLIILFNGANDDVCLINEAVFGIINRFGYLLSRDLLRNINELYKIEKQGRIENLRGDTRGEYLELKKTTIKLLNSEFNDLQNIYNKNFYAYKNKFTMAWHRKIVNIAKNGCITITLSIYLLIAITFVVNLFEPVPILVNNAIANFLYFFIMLIFTITSMVLIMYYFGVGLGKIQSVSGKIKRHYQDKEQVPETANYKCRICGKTIKLVKNSSFPRCQQHSFSKRLKSIFIINTWKFIG